MKRKCNKCKRELRLEDFHRDSSKSGGRGYTCKDCKKQASRKWHEDNADKKREYQRTYYRANKEQIRIRDRIRMKKNQQRLRNAVLVLLSVTTSHCVRCGISDVRVLDVDHINGGGHQERKKLGTVGVWRKILKMSPDEARMEYRLLCKNCNWIAYLDRNL